MTESAPSLTPEARSRERVHAAWIGIAQQFGHALSRSPVLKHGWIILVVLIAAVALQDGFYEADTTGTAAYYYRTNKFTGSVLFCEGYQCYPPRILSRPPS